MRENTQQKPDSPPPHKPKKGKVVKPNSGRDVVRPKPGSREPDKDNILPID